MRKVYAFDFDGTLTTKDTLLEFIRFAKGRSSFWQGFLRYAHLLVLMKLGLYPNWKAKQQVFGILQPHPDICCGPKALTPSVKPSVKGRMY